MNDLQICRSREGAWIEIDIVAPSERTPLVAPARERGLKLFAICPHKQPAQVAPARERGLKFILNILVSIALLSLPRGSVD